MAVIMIWWRLLVLAMVGRGFVWPAGRAQREGALAAGREVEEALRRMSKEQLKDHMKRRGLKVSGTKDELIGRALQSGSSPRRLAALEVDEPPPFQERKVLDGLLRDELEIPALDDARKVAAYASSTRNAWRPTTRTDRAACGIVVVAPNASRDALRAFTDTLAFVCDSVAVATTDEAGGDACERWLRQDRRAESLGLVLVDTDAVASDDWDALVLWRTASRRLATAKQPVLAVYDAAAQQREALDADAALRANSNCADYLVRALAGLVSDLPRRDDDEALLLCSAWFDLHLGRRRAKTAGPRTSQIWIDG